MYIGLASTTLAAYHMQSIRLPAMLEAARQRGFRWHCMALLVLSAALSGCAAGVRNDQDASYLYRSGDDFVRLAPIEPGAPPNSHPFAISEGQLRRLLAGIEVRGAASIGKAPVFLKEELETIVPPLASALSKAGPNQDVAFAVTSRRGLFGSMSPKSVTTGRLFMRGDSLNLIFGLVQERRDIGEIDYAGVKPEGFVPGSRERRIGDRIWKIEPGRGQLHNQRGDWLVFDRSVIPAAGATQAAPSTPGDATSGSDAPTKAQEIENRLRVLDALRKRGAITEQEYRERRRAILEQL